MIRYRCYGCRKEIETISECWVKCTKCGIQLTKIGGQVDIVKQRNKKNKTNKTQKKDKDE